MVKVVIKYLDSNEITAIVRELQSQGLQTGLDFDFAYTPGSYDYSTQETIARHTIFTFYNESAGTWFSLKYQNHSHE